MIREYMPTRKEILKILTIVKKSCLPSGVLRSKGAGRPLRENCRGSGEMGEKLMTDN
jgi:hypothetical protein